MTDNYFDRSAMKAEDILERMQVTGKARTYALGCHESRVTIYSQQVRALNLAWALTELGQIDSHTRIVIIGAGAAGLTAALGLGGKGARVDIVERNEVIFRGFGETHKDIFILTLTTGLTPGQ